MSKALIHPTTLPFDAEAVSGTLVTFLVEGHPEVVGFEGTEVAYRIEDGEDISGVEPGKTYILITAGANPSEGVSNIQVNLSDGSDLVSVPLDGLIQAVEVIKDRLAQHGL